jgi:hypothetical protein
MLSRGRFLFREKILSENGIEFHVTKGAFGKTSLAGQTLKTHPGFFQHAGRGHVFTPGGGINPVDRGLLPGKKDI